MHNTPYNRPHIYVGASDRKLGEWFEYSAYADGMLVYVYVLPFLPLHLPTSSPAVYSSLQTQSKEPIVFLQVVTELHGS